VAAGADALGEAAFKDDVGLFWGLLETRPYMRACHECALALWRAGERNEALAHYRDMLRLNPNDNQGIRYLLMDALLELGHDAEAAALLELYKDDGSAAWAWSGVLLAFRRDGDSPAARKTLAKAAKVNRTPPETHIANVLGTFGAEHMRIGGGTDQNHGAQFSAVFGCFGGFRRCPIAMSRPIWWAQSGCPGPCPTTSASETRTRRSPMYMMPPHMGGLARSHNLAVRSVGAANPAAATQASVFVEGGLTRRHDWAALAPADGCLLELGHEAEAAALLELYQVAYGGPRPAWRGLARLLELAIRLSEIETYF